MANTFKNVTFQGGAVAADVVSPVGTACPDGSQITIIGMTIANLVSDVISVGVKMTDNHSSPTTTWIVKDAPIATGGSLVVVGGDQKLCLEYNDTGGLTSGDQIQVVSNTANSIDVVVSYLEIT